VVRSAAEAARIKQKQALEQERGRADTLARELTSLRAELNAARATGLEAVQAAEAEKKQKLCGHYNDVLTYNQKALATERRFLAYSDDPGIYRAYVIHNFHFTIYGATFLG
jgi:hypothetical protein